MKKKFIKYLGVKNSLQWCPHFGELVFLKCVLLNMNKSGKVLTSVVSSTFDEIYTQLNITNGSAGIDEAAMNFIKREAYKAVSQAGFVSIESGHDIFVVHKKLRKKLSDNDCKQLIAIIDQRLELYVASRPKFDLPHWVAIQVEALAKAFSELDKYYRLQYDNALAVEDSQSKQVAQQLLGQTQQCQNTISDLQVAVTAILQAEQTASTANPWVQPYTVAPDNVTELLIDNQQTPIAMTLLGERVTVSSWPDLWRSFCEIILINKPYVVAELDQNAAINNRGLVFSYIQSDIQHKSSKLANGMYVELGCDGARIVSMCDYIILLCGYEVDDLVIEYQEDGGERT